MQMKFTLSTLRKAFKKTVSLSVLLALMSGMAFAQTFTNGNLSTGATTNSGVAAPAGKTWSECQNPTGNTTIANTNSGFGAQIASNNSLADDFTVPAGPAWNLTKVRVYAYSTGYSGVASPFNDIRIRIHDGNPLTGTPAVVYGDLTTNRFSSSTNTNVFRIFNTVVTPASTPGTTRIVWEIEGDVNVSLAPGTYWLEFQVGTTLTSNFVVPSTPLGIRSAPGSNAIQSIAGVWDALMDDGQGSASPAPVPSDIVFEIDYTTGACSGTPNPGNTITSDTAVCPMTSFTLSLENSIAGSGVTYQWQSASAVTGPFTDIAGATNSDYTVPDLAANTYYQCIVACSGNADTSVPVLVELNPPSSCYCIPPASDCSDADAIFNVTLGALNNTSTCSPTGYSNFTNDPNVVVPDLVAGVENPIQITAGDGSWTESVGLWVDYDRDGVFEPTEFTFINTSSTPLRNGIISVPGNVTSGPTRMRIKVQFSSAVTATSACTAAYIGYGEFEDYTVNILPCIPLTLTTNPVSVTGGCGDEVLFTAAATGTFPSFYWEYRTSPTGIWLNVPNAAPYSGVDTDSLKVIASTDMDGYQFRAVFEGGCTAVDFTDVATLTVTQPSIDVTPTSATICEGEIQQLTITTGASASSSFIENFDVAIPLPAGWAQVNNSAPASNGYFQGNSAAFPSYNGAPNSYIAVNWQSTTGLEISNWLFTPTLHNVNNGDSLTFWTRTPTGAFPDEWPDRLEVRFSENGASTNVGNTTSSVGDFTTLYLTINPLQDYQVYPQVWTQFKVVVAGLTGPVSGRFAFRYWVVDDGTFSYANYIGIDNVVFGQQGANASGVWGGPAGTIFTDAAATIPYDGVSELNSVYVKPDVTSDYTVDITSAAGCVYNTATIPVTVHKGFETGSTSTVTDASSCEAGTVSFNASVPTEAVGVEHQWQVSTDNGATWTDVANGAGISGATTATLNIENVDPSLDGNMYRDVLSVESCGSTLNSSAGTLTVNANPVVVLSASPTTSLAPGMTTTLTAAVSPNAGSTYTWFRNGTPVDGATGNTLVVNVDQLGEYSVEVDDVNACGGASTASINVTGLNSDKLWIYPSPNQGSFQVRYYSVPGNNPLPRMLNIYDGKGSRIYTQTYLISAPYTQMNVNLSNYSKGIFTVELTDQNGNRIKTGRVIIE